MKRDNVEIFEDSNVITLYDDDENPVEFYEIACVELDDKFYGLLQPVEPMEGLGEDEAIIFEIKEGEGEEDMFLPIGDEKILENVFSEYVKAVSDMENCDCCHCGDCDDEDCNGDCDCNGHDGCKDGECSCEHHHNKKK